jgi:recombination protein RecT
MAYTNNYSKSANAGMVPTNAPLNQRGNKLAPAQPEDKLGVYLGKSDIKAWLNNVLGDTGKAESFVANVTSCVAGNPTLAECSSSTIVSSALVANSLKLSMSSSLGHCYLVPFEDRKNGRKVATFILGYKGYIQLAIRSGQYKKINVIPIKQGEVVKYDRIRGEVTFNPITSDLVWEQTPTVGYYAYFELINGYKKEIYWSIEKMQYHADKYSKAYSMEKAALLKAGQVPANEMWKYSSYWYSDFDGMACKTMIRQLLSKDGVMSIDMQKAFEEDDDFRKEEFFTDGVTGDKLPPRQPAPTPDDTDNADGNVDPVTGEITADTETTDAETQFNFFEGINADDTAK